MAHRCAWIAATVLVAGLAACSDDGQTPDGGQRTASAEGPVASYAPARLPVDCAAVLAKIPAGLVRDVVNLDNQAPEKQLLLCRARGTSPEDGFTLQLQLTVQVMPADQTGAKLPQWQQATVRGVLDGDCTGESPLPSAAAPPYTLRCATDYSDPAVGVHLGMAGDSGRVVGVDATAYYSGKPDKDAAQRFADRVADAAAQAGLTA